LDSAIVLAEDGVKLQELSDSTDAMGNLTSG
jgi:hypothetical protein